MTNPRGTWAESQIVNYLKAEGFDKAERIPKKGSRDEGDVHVTDGVIIEAKNYAGGAQMGQPGQGQLEKWMGQLEAEMTHRAVEIGFLVVKRKGTQNPAHWFCYMNLNVFAITNSHLRPQSESRDDVICMDLAAVVRLLKRREQHLAWLAEIRAREAAAHSGILSPNNPDLLSEDYPLEACS